jgi:hypothetical protein
MSFPQFPDHLARVAPGVTINTQLLLWTSPGSDNEGRRYLMFVFQTPTQHDGVKQKSVYVDTMFPFAREFWDLQPCPDNPEVRC